MADKDNEQEDLHVVVINHEEQYALWPDYAEVPNGWKTVFGPAPKQPCLDFVKENWTDMRPKSLREADALQNH